MGYFNNIGNDIDVSNAHVKRYFDGTPKLDAYRKLMRTSFGKQTSDMTPKQREIFVSEKTKFLMDDLDESMFDQNGEIDPNIRKILSKLSRAFDAGWNAYIHTK